MTTADLKTLLEQQISARNDARGKGGAAKVAKMLSVSDSQLSQYRSGAYPCPETIEQRIREKFGNETVNCPELRCEISLADCSGYKRREPTTDSFYARMYRACQKCANNQ